MAIEFGRSSNDREVRVGAALKPSRGLNLARVSNSGRGLPERTQVGQVTCVPQATVAKALEFLYQRNC